MALSKETIDHDAGDAIKKERKQSSYQITGAIFRPVKFREQICYDDTDNNGGTRWWCCNPMEALMLTINHHDMFILCEPSISNFAVTITCDDGNDGKDDDWLKAQVAVHSWSHVSQILVQLHLDSGQGSNTAFSIFLSEHIQLISLDTMMMVITGIVLMTTSPSWACTSQAAESEPESGNDPEAWLRSQKALRFCATTPGWMTCEFSPK